MVTVALPTLDSTTVARSTPSSEKLWGFPFTCLTARLVHFEESLSTRSLVPAMADATDFDVLTPNHFLLGTAGSGLPSNFSCNFDHRRRNARAQAFSDAMWNR